MDPTTTGLSRYEISLYEMIEAVLKKQRELLKEAAYGLEQSVNIGIVPRKDEYFATLFSALAYDIAGEYYDRKRIYLKLTDLTTDYFSGILESEIDSKKLSASLGYLGLRQLSPFRTIYDEIVGKLRTKKELGVFNISPEEEDDYITLFGMLNTVSGYYTAIEKKDSDSIRAIFHETNKLFESFPHFSPSPPIKILGLLYLEDIRALNERLVVNLQISNKMKNALYNQGYRELWPPQLEAIHNGIFEGTNVVYSAPPGTGKSFLAYLTAGRLNPGKQLLYLVPTRSLSSQVFDDLQLMLGSNSRLAISDRDRTEFDEGLSDVDVIVSTYEKMDALLRRNKIHARTVQSVIVDEMQYLSDARRGLTLEFLLTEFLRKMPDEKPQIITLSGLLSKDDSREISNWLDARLVSTTWRGVRTEEMIFYNGKLYYRDGTFLPTKISARPDLPKREQRELACHFFARQAMTTSQQLLIAANSKSYCFVLAKKLASYQTLLDFFDTDFINAKASKQQVRAEVTERIKSIEPELPGFASALKDLIQNGVAYHHAGLPSKYRQIVEDAIRKHAVDVVVATNTLEAGVNMPIKTVIFFDPRRRVNQRTRPIEVRSYRNMAGRAGRPGFHDKGEVIILATSEKEVKQYQDHFWKGEIERLKSSFNFVGRNKLTRSSLQSQLLGFVVSREETSIESITEYLMSTWFWKTENPDKHEILKSEIKKNIGELVSNGFIAMNENVVSATDAGITVNQSMFSPFSASMILRCMDKIRNLNLQENEIDSMLLLLAGLPTEISTNDKLVKNITAPTKLIKLSKQFEEIENIDQQRLELAAKYSTILQFWTNSMPTEQILESCGLSVDSDTASLEESLSKDIYWVMTTIISIVESSGDHDEAIIERMKQLAEYCKIGSNDSFIISLLSSGLEHIGRTTAIKISKLMLGGLGLSSINEEEFSHFFPNNRETAKILFREIKAAGLI
jgi:helicase